MSKELTLQEVRTVATSAFKSGLVSSVKNQEAMFTMMLIAQSEGINPIQALNAYDVIQGRVALKANEALARFNDRGGRVKWLKTDKESAKALFTSKYNDPVEYEYTTEDAKDAGLLDKDNWKKNLKAMLRKRCQVGGIRMSDPRALNNLYTSDEVVDFAAEDAPKIDEEVEVVEVVEPEVTTADLKRKLANKLTKDFSYTNTLIKEFAEYYSLNENEELLNELVSDNDKLTTYVENFEKEEEK